MKRIGTTLCLLALSLFGGWLYAFKPALGTRPPVSRSAASLRHSYDQAIASRKQGDYQKAGAIALAGFREAQLKKEHELEARFLWESGNSHFAQRRYQEALTEYLEARDGFARLGESASRRSVEGNIASLYSQIGELESAIEAMKRATDEDQSYDPTGSRTRRLITLASLLAQDGKFEEANRIFREGIIAAARIDDPELLSNAWDRLGGELLSRGMLAEAEDALLEAFRIRKLGHLPSLAGSYGRLGLLRLAQGDTRSASTLLDASIRESKSSRVRTPEWRLYHARGRLRLSEGRLEEAHADFRLALELARNYRLTAPSSDATRVSLEGVLQEVYTSFVETGARLYFASGRRQFAQDTFQALEENRAASLASRIRERRELHSRMPQTYWDTLQQLQSAESEALLDDSETLRQRMRQLRSQIVEMEVTAGGTDAISENELLSRAQHSLGGDSVLLSFHLGEKASKLWVISASDLALYSLPARATVTELVARLQRAVITRDALRERLGRELYQMLFGALEPRYRNKSRWLLSLDEGLFETPFAALIVSGKPTSPVYLIERHAIRIVSGAANMRRHSGKNRVAGMFVGIGDPVYNAADSRWRAEIQKGPSSWLPSRWTWKTSAAAPRSLGLSRLPGASAEIDACAREWRSGSILLKGREVTRENVRRMARSGPAILHFATHILQERPRSTDAQIALSLSGKAQDELLGPSEIGRWSLDGGLVVLSGCSSGVAVVRPATGLMGMTRAWLAAGAAGVVATSWSTPDDAGPFFERFYRELQRSEGRDPAEALRIAQVDTLRSGGWRSDPAYWSAYFLLGNY